MNPRFPFFKNYGGRGITICERWAIFENFLADMGERPPEHSLGRINNEGNYEPGNCHWELNLHQQNNRRNNALLEHDNRRQTIAEWSRETGIKRATIEGRLRKNWSVSDALTVRPWARTRWTR